MKEAIKNEAKSSQRHTAWKVLGIFALVAILICGFVFIFNYNRAYDDYTGAGWFPPSFGIIVWHYLLAIIFIFVAIILKIALRKRVRIWMLLLASVLIPIFCYNFNFRAYGKDGFLYPLVDEGGIFHFIVIGDYNFDGMNDERYHILYDERQISSGCGGHFDDTIIDFIETTAIGTGASLEGTFCFYDWENRIIDLHLDKSDVEFKQIKITVVFQDPTMAERTAFYLRDSDGVLLDHTVNVNNSVSIVFDADTCADWQNTSENERIKIPIKYVVND